MTDPEHDAALLPESSLPPDHRSGFVAVIGRPNVGKSTLFNRILGQKIAITSPKPQTTRDQLLGIWTEEDAQILFLDTPGIHRAQHKLGAYMNTVAQETIEDADVILWLVEIDTPPTEEDIAIAAMLTSLAKKARGDFGPLVLGLNKADAAQVSEPPQLVDEYAALLGDLPFHPVVLSGLTGSGVDSLIALLRDLLPVGPRYYEADQVTDLQTRFIVAELIREKALNLLQQEVPHSIAVVVDEFTPRSENLTYIAAVIYVERSSQKGIVLGEGGRMIKRIGRAARPEIEELLGTRVYLELWVKVWEKWRRREPMLRRLGYAT